MSVVDFSADFFIQYIKMSPHGQDFMLTVPLIGTMCRQHVQDSAGFLHVQWSALQSAHDTVLM